MSEQFDVVVIGAGPGGYVCAIRAAQLGFKTACVEERKSLGGTCLNVGCIPSKALLESSHHYHMAKHGLSEHGIELDGVDLNLKKLIKRKDEVVDGITKGVEFLFKKNKIAWLNGRGSLVDSGTVAVQDENGKSVNYQARHIVIATGSAPIEIPSAPFDHKIIIDSTDALSLKKVPKELIVIGGGVIGLELGSVWCRLGAKVTVVEATDKILGATDVGISREMQKILSKQGIEFHLKTLLKTAAVKNKKVTIECEHAGKSIQLSGDQLLVAVGRKPFTENLGLEKVGLKMDERGRILVDHGFKTSVANVYAIGDVIHGPMLAHKAEEEGIAVAENLAGKSGHVNYDAIPSIVYTWPEVASVGASEEMLKNDGVKYKKGQFSFKANGRAKAMGSVEGFVKVLADEKTDQLLGVHIVGPMASEMIAEAAIAFEYKASAEDIARSVHAHPTLAEAFKEAALGVDGRMIHS